jgi:signal transduction histidine kinase
MKLLEQLKKLPLIKEIPGFNTMPEFVNPHNLRFYKLCNLVHTFGMMAHISWVFIFAYFHIDQLLYLNIFSVAAYIFNIYINRSGYHFSSVVVMVAEIIVHQIIAIRLLGWEYGFQHYIIVIGLFPFLMPRGQWFTKALILITCTFTYLLLEHLSSNMHAQFTMPDYMRYYFNITNAVFAFGSMAFSGGYFNIAMHETEEKLEQKTKELIESEKVATLGKVATEMAHEIQNPLNFVNNFAEINEEMIRELKEEITHQNKTEEVLAMLNDLEQNSSKIKNNGKRVSAIVGKLQLEVNELEANRNAQLN